LFCHFSHPPSQSCAQADKISERGGTVPPELVAQIAAAARAFQGIPEPAASAPPKPESAREQMERALKSVAAFRTGDARGVAAGTLRTLLRNVLDKPSEAKFRSVNLTNDKIKERLCAVTGSLAFLRAAGACCTRARARAGLRAQHPHTSL
jgi:hypothetical protein